MNLKGIKDKIDDIRVHPLTRAAEDILDHPVSRTAISAISWGGLVAFVNLVLFKPVTPKHERAEEEIAFKITQDPDGKLKLDQVDPATIKRSKQSKPHIDAVPVPSTPHANPLSDPYRTTPSEDRNKPPYNRREYLPSADATELGAQANALLARIGKEQKLAAENHK